jgi:hypothetical protein
MLNIFLIIFILVFSFISKSLACDHCEYNDPTMQTTRHDKTSANAYSYREDAKERHDKFHSHKKSINSKDKEHKAVEFRDKDGNLKKDKGIEIDKNLDILDLYKNIANPLKKVPTKKSTKTSNNI